MKSVMSHSFSNVPAANVQRSRFDRSAGYKTTFDAGYLVPFYFDECLPGDTFNLRTSGFARMATPIHPIMDNAYMDTHYFAIPWRILWTNFIKFMGEQDNPSDSIDFQIPTTTAPVGGYSELSLQDYFGLPTKVEGLTHNSLLLRAYNLVWNEWFRDENLQDSAPFDKDSDGPDDPADFVLRRRGKRYDYFTSCLPAPQKGQPVSLSLGDTAPVAVRDSNPGFAIYVENDYGANGTSNLNSSGAVLQEGIDEERFPGFPYLVADLSATNPITVNDLRTAFQLQRFLEAQARGGTRYPELVMSLYNVYDPQMAVMQRPEYIGGGSTPVIVNAVASTTDIEGVGGSGVNDTVGSLGAFATASFSGHGFTKSFTEHCFVLGLVSVRADLTYQKGLDRMWSRSIREDIYFPQFAHLGEQAVLNKEIFADGSAADEAVFGYQERFGEMRYKNSIISGLFRSNAATSLDIWHLSQDFDSLPLLNNEFIEDEPPIDRVVETPDEPHFIGDFYHKLICVRPMPLYGVPGYIDRF